MAALKQTSVSIVGVEFSPEKVITDERGAVLHMMKNNHRFMEQQFGEIYFSEINPGVTKGWKRHNKMTQRLCVPSGLIKFVMYDDREDSPSYRKVDLITVGRSVYFGILKIPPGIWYAFQNQAKQVSLLANCASIPHDPEEQSVLPLDNNHIPFAWKR